jgi:hypothetical protein
MLLQVEPRRLKPNRRNADFLERELERLTLFAETRQFYLPPLPDQEEEGVLYNVVLLESHAQAENQHLPLMQRYASMTVLGWRVFGALLRTLQVREAEGEADLRRVF